MSEDLLFKGRATIDKAALFKICSWVPHPGQQAVHDAGPNEYPGGHRFRAVACGIRFGKSAAAAMEMVCAAIAPNDYDGWTGWVCAPFHNLASIVFDNVCAIFAQHLPHLVIKSQQHEGILVVRNLANREAKVLRRSSERGLVSLTGSSVDFLVVDEASAVPDVIWESALSTRLVDRKGAVLAISTPRGTGGWFANMVRKGLSGADSDTWAIRLPSYVNPRLDPREVYKMKLRLRPHAYAQEVEAQFVAASGRVYDPEVVRRQAVGKPQKPESGAVYYGGLDLAANRDFTVLTIAKRTEDGRCEVVFVDRFHKLDVQTAVSRIAAACKRYETTVRADATGLGAPIVDLIRAAEVPCEGVVLTQQRKAELISGLGVLLEKGRMTLLAPDFCPEMVTELEQYAFTDEDETKRTSAPDGAHDDCVISAALVASYFSAANHSGRSYVVGRSIPLTGSPHVQDDEPADVVEDEVEEPVDDGPRVITSGEATPIPEDYRRRPLANPRPGLIRFRRF